MTTSGPPDPPSRRLPRRWSRSHHASTCPASLQDGRSVGQSRSPEVLGSSHARDQVLLLRRRGALDRRLDHMTTSTVSPKVSTAFFVQAAISFAVSALAISFGIAYLHVSPWVRAFLALGLLYVITSTFTLAKCVRDKQE